MRKLKIGDKPDKINICPICCRHLPENPKIREVCVCTDATWQFDGKEWEVVIVADDVIDVIEQVVNEVD